MSIQDDNLFILILLGICLTMDAVVVGGLELTLMYVAIALVLLNGL